MLRHSERIQQKEPTLKKHYPEQYDTADRDSFYSSIFNDVIYVESFFKDSSQKDGGVTQMTEEYLCNIILNDLEPKRPGIQNPGLKSLFNRIKKNQASEELRFINDLTKTDKNIQEDGVYKQKIFKTIFTLQNYIIFLAYRSNGTPKKMAALTERLLYKRKIYTNEGSEKQKEDTKKFL